MVLQGAGVLFLGTMTTQLLTGLVYLFAARGVSPAEYGTAATAASVALLGVAIVDFGGSTFALRERSSGRMTQASWRHWSKSKSLIILASAPIVGYVACLCAGALRLSTCLTVGLLFLGASLAMIQGVPLRVGLRFGVMVFITVISRLPSAGLIIFFSVRHQLGSNSLVLLLAMSSLVEAALYTAVELRGVGIGNQAGRGTFRWVNPYRGGVGVGLSSAANSLGSLDISLVRVVSGAAVAGEYAAVNRWMGPIGLTSQAVTQAVFPRMSAVDASGRRGGLISALWTVSLSLPIIGTIALCAPWIVPAFLGEAYRGSVVTLQLLCLAIVFAVACQPLSAALVAWQLELHAAACVLGGLVVQLSSQAVGASLYGSRGAAGGAVVGQLVTVVALCIVMRRTHSRWGISTVLVVPDDGGVPSVDGVAALGRSST
jgi:O-antigen/teichoic acid export membrane protein